jgi:hypothetical protein
MGLSKEERRSVSTKVVVINGHVSTLNSNSNTDTIIYQIQRSVILSSLYLPIKDKRLFSGGEFALAFLIKKAFLIKTQEVATVGNFRHLALYIKEDRG